MKRLVLLFFYLVFLHSAFGQDSLLNVRLKEQSYILQFGKNEMTGQGMDFLVREASKSSFLLIGEAHGISQIPQFAEALFKSLLSEGYNSMAVETGPHTAKKLQDMIAQPEWESALKNHFEKYPWSIPFFNLKEEVEMLNGIASTNNEIAIWGLDQEFAASFRMFFDYLINISENKPSRSTAEDYYQLAESSFKESFESKNPGKSILMKLQESDFNKLNEAFAGQDEALEIIEELQVSLNIYKMWFMRQGYQSNFDRAMLMKKHFMTYYQEAIDEGRNPKVMIKLGANHAYRGLNGLNVPDIGNFVSELANQRGAQSFHVYVTGKKGTQNVFNPFSQSGNDRHRPFKPSDAIERLDLSRIEGHEDNNDWIVVDLRPLRSQLFNRTLNDIDEDFEKLIWGYDALVIIPETVASSN